MVKYRDEAAFSNALVKKLRARGYFVQRIESPLTGRGIPDIYCIDPSGSSMWIELKRVHRDAIDSVLVPWRPGQQAWLTQVWKKGVKTYTWVACDNCLVKIPMSHHYNGNWVSLKAAGVTTTPQV